MTSSLSDDPSLIVALYQIYELILLRMINIDKLLT